MPSTVGLGQTDPQPVFAVIFLQTFFGACSKVSAIFRLF
uniref:Uncharacterized protein n=1 Tax=Rheinheimera sp. BAL341 TaxID=1708203 RepID=A0A486XSJ3_9GAMM